MDTLKSLRIDRILAIGALAGIAGGITEIGWITLYGAATGTPIAPVARGIVTSAIPALATTSWSATLGILIHLGFAIVLGIGLALFFRLVLPRFGARDFVFGLALLALTGVWAINFLVALPHINPAFVHLLPYSVTLLSKLLFGLSAAAVFRASSRRPVRLPAR